MTSALDVPPHGAFTVTRADHRTEVIPFPARDGTPLTLVHVSSAKPLAAGTPEKGPVLLVHGAGVRAELFRPPLPRTLVDVLLEDGWDVWLLNWRASVDFEPLSWTLGDAAVYDHPAAVEFVLNTTGTASLKAVVHCQGSTSFTMAAVAGLLPQVDTVVSNAVSLHPVVPAWSTVKITYLAELLKPFTPYLSPAWGYKSNGYLSRLLRFAVKSTHRECDNLVCRLVSFTYGSGHPALWSHENLDEATHQWINGEFAEVPFSFFSEMGHSILARHIVAAGNHPELPSNFVGQAPRTDARFAFLAGEDNRCFLPESQARSYAFFQRHRPGKDSLHLLPGYGHLDVFFGARAWRDTYPIIVKELNT
jgi:pimeloyl-ACP methyl ester carboxylesterase